MKISKFKNSDDAVVGIIVAILLIGLIILVISIIQTVFIPNWMKQIEAEHMDDVAGQFSQLKFAIDIQSSLQRRDLPVSVPVTIGNKQFPILQSSQSFGRLDIIDNAGYMLFGNTTNSTIINFGDIIFESYNSYFLDQFYIYECGSIIVSQDEGNIITVKPDFSYEFDDPDLSFNFTIVNISDVGNKNSASGYGTYPIRVEYDNIENEILPENITIIRIFSDYPESWHLYFKTILNDIGLSSDLIDDVLIKSGNLVEIDLSEIISSHDPITDIDIDVQTISVLAQIAPGWVEE
jgi:hypothetical protein